MTPCHTDIKAALRRAFREGYGCYRSITRETSHLVRTNGHVAQFSGGRLVGRWERVGRGFRGSFGGRA